LGPSVVQRALERSHEARSTKHEARHPFRNMARVVGIDLGTTNSLVAYVKDGVPVVIRDRSGDALVPSVVSVPEDGTVVVGREAQRRLLTEARRTAYSVKRFMGKGREDVQDEARHF